MNPQPPAELPEVLREYAAAAAPPGGPTWRRPGGDPAGEHVDKDR